ncbi:NADH-quinone oxidoreductase subunit NuoE family protein [Candidatus Magnetomonas plexicatena]|uniref:NADH-quinone oxidoreductase subunit NuoE family protein n=1 Tax=Candidatus Magnetomonas plexicatena TaxID=2552947 RepID=UPI001C73F1D9|nr:NAD(P)H-dependent oxidoreductase subunit E [Nitrospirales bacterium LBB_01]
MPQVTADRLRLLRTTVCDLMGLYASRQGVLLPSLSAAEEIFGFVSPEAIEEVSSVTGVPTAEIRGVATFYAMYKTKPMGRHIIQLCTNVSCMIEGAYDLVAYLEEKYGLTPGGTTSDGRFSLIIMECIGACGTAPAMILDTDSYDNLTKDRLDTVLENYK